MQILSRTITTVALFSSGFFSAYAASINVRAPIQGSHGNTTKPADGESVNAGGFFPFEYHQANGCKAGYSPISVYMSREAPSKQDIQDDGKLYPGSYIFHIGDWVISNFDYTTAEEELPPNNLELYVIPDIANNTDLYLTIVETSQGCPPTGTPEYGMETTRVVYITS